MFQPGRLYSPQTIILRQSGQAHELATVFCSILLGAGYDAYVVWGYANKDTALRIMSRIDSPYPPEKKVEVVVEKVVEKPRYIIKPPPELKSKYMEMMETRILDKLKAEESARNEAERLRLLAEEVAPPDELEGLRYHSWVLLKPSRDVDELTFVEPTNGLWYPITDKKYFGIEAIWNDKNYWVNLQNCSKGLASLSYEFNNVEFWEHFLPGEPKETRKVFVDPSQILEEDEKIMMRNKEEKHLDVPNSWSLKINIPHELFALRFPGGINITYYKRTYVEEYGPFVQADGLVVIIHRYYDFDCNILLRKEHLYKLRADKLVKKVFENNLVTDFFARGREDCVSEHIYDPQDNTLDSKREIRFYVDARYDSLDKIFFEAECITEIYKDRDDRLYLRQSRFAKKGYPPPGYIEGPRKIILKITEKFSRNLEIDAELDVASREFNALDGEILLQFHFGEGRATASSRTYIKPKLVEKSEDLIFNPNMTYGYQADIEAKAPTQVELFAMFQNLWKAEEKTTITVRAIEDMITDFLKLRDLENTELILEVPLFNRQQNLSMRKAMLERRKKEEAAKKVNVVEEINFVAPLIEKYGDPSRYTRAKIMKIKNQCLTEFKNLLLARGQNMHQQFLQVQQYVIDKKQWYAEHEDTITEEEETQYFEDIIDKTFLLQVLEIRMNRHKDTSCDRYKALVSFLDKYFHLDG